MEKVKRHKRLLSAVAVLFLVALVIIGIYWQTLPKMLYSGEVRGYEGQDLSSIGDFIENSIKGPQHINESTYRLTIKGLVNKTIEYT